MSVFSKYIYIYRYLSEWTVKVESESVPTTLELNADIVLFYKQDALSCYMWCILFIESIFRFIESIYRFIDSMLMRLLLVDDWSAWMSGCMFHVIIGVLSRAFGITDVDMEDADKYVTRTSADRSPFIVVPAKLYTTIYLSWNIW